MTEGPGQQPPQEPRNSSANGEREVLEGRVIPSRNQSERGADPRRQFRQQNTAPDPQAPEPGPAWSPQADAAAQAAAQPTLAQPGEPWSATPPQPTLDAAPQHEPTQIAPAQQQYAPQVPPQAQQPAPQAQPQPYIPPQQGGYGYPQAQQPPAQEQPQAQQPPGGHGYPQAQQPAPEPQAQAQQPQGGYGYPQQQQPPAQQGGYGYPQPQQPPAPAPQAPQPQQGGYGYPQAQQPAPQAQAPAPAVHPQGPQVPFAGGAVPRPAPRAQETDLGGGAGGPGGAPAAEADTPDWNALAEQQQATGRRRRVLMVTGGILAVAVIAGGVATAVVMSGDKGDKPKAGPSSSGSTTASQQPLPPAPTFSSVAPPPPANPLDYINTAAKDKAPLTPATLFPGKQFVWHGRTYVKTNSDVTTSCAKNARQQVASSLTANGCQKLIRATFTNGGVAVTVGVAVFADDKHAKKLQHVSQYLAPLSGGGVPAFCRAVRCQMTSNAVGRYAYFAIAGYKNGKTLAANDTEGRQAANDASDFAFNRIVQRGKDAAAADPSRK